MGKIQEPREKRIDQAKVDLLDIKEHAQMVENVVFSLRSIHADLMEYNLNYARNEGRSSIEERFNYLEIYEPAAQYLQTFGPFYRLYNYLKARYKVKVLDYCQPTTHNR
jgi:hypothetical protein